MKLHLFVTLCWAISYTNYVVVQADEANDNAITESQPLPGINRNNNDSSMNVDNDSDTGSKDSEEGNEKDDNEEDASVDEATSTNESEDSETGEDETESDEKETESDEENKEETNAVQPKETITKETLTNESEASETVAVEDEDEDENEEEKESDENEKETESDEENKEETNAIQPNETIPKESVFAPVPAPVVTNGMTTSSANKNTITNKQPSETIVTSVETKEGMEALPSGNGDSNESNEANDVKNVIGSSVDATTALLKQTITDIAAINISMDAWRNQTWANKSPREVVDLIETEFNNMYHDRYVHVVFISMGITSLLFTLYVVQQIFEHPQGMVAKFCRCSVACIRILLCPIYTILCCPCCGSRNNKKNRPNASKYSHVPVEDDEEDPKKQ